MAKVGNKTHGLFWTLLKQTDGYKAAYKEVIKEGLVHEYSGGKTTSLSELYERFPADYARMIEFLKGDPRKRKERYWDEQDKYRKQTIAACCRYLDKIGYQFSSREEKIRYAKACICRASNCGEFNKIPSSKLTMLIHLYNNKSDVDIDAPAVGSRISKN